MLGLPDWAILPSVPKERTDFKATVASSALILSSKPTYLRPLLEINEIVLPIYCDMVLVGP